MITYKHSVYSHDKNVIGKFNDLRRKWDYIYPIQLSLHKDKINMSADVFSLWVNFIVNKNLLLPKIEKVMTHHFVHYKVNALLNNEEIKNTLSKYNYDLERCYLLAYFLVQNLNVVLIKSIENNKLLDRRTLITILTTDYFLNDENTLSANNKHYIHQKILLTTFLNHLYYPEFKFKSLIEVSIFEANDSINTYLKQT